MLANDKNIRNWNIYHWSSYGQPRRKSCYELPKLWKEMVWLTWTHECFPTKDWRPMKYKSSHHPKRSFRCPTFSTSFSQAFQAMSQIQWALLAALKVHNSSSVKSELYLLVWQVNIVQLITKTYKGELQHMSRFFLFFESTWWEYILHTTTSKQIHFKYNSKQLVHIVHK